MAGLLHSLRRAGATGQVSALLDRDPAAHTSLDDPYRVESLLDALGMVGAWTQDAELIERLPAAGQFEVFRRYGGREDQFPFGRDADGRSAKRWAWTGLG